MSGDGQLIVRATNLLEAVNLGFAISLENLNADEYFAIGIIAQQLRDHLVTNQNAECESAKFRKTQQKKPLGTHERHQ